MKIRDLHGWEVSPKEAVAIQRELAGELTETLSAGFAPKLIAAADVSSNRFSSRVYAAVVVLTLPGLDVVETRTASGEARMPYVPGLLSFREIPVLAEAFSRVESEPDVVMFDGHGRAHPRRIGLACHAGLLLGLPSFGCAKSVLVGDYDEPGRSRGSRAELVHKGELIGCALRTRRAVKPVFVSTGHMMDLETAVGLTLDCAPRYRVPEPTRAAHDAANEARRSDMS